MPGYTVTVTGPPVVGAECYCREWEPCQSCEDAADGLVGTEVYDSGVGGRTRTFAVAGADSKDGRVTVHGGGVWAYLDDVRPLISRQTVGTLDEMVDRVCDEIRRVNFDSELEREDAIDEARGIDPAGGALSLPDGSMITVEPAGEAGER